MAVDALFVTVGDEDVTIELADEGTWTLPIGVRTVVDDQLERADRPAPEQLTNALGIVSDHLDDVVRESPVVAATPTVIARGPHVDALARVELGLDSVPADYVLQRSDADDVFRTLVSEPISERVHNPGLRPDEVETIIATCCVVLAVMRRLELTSIGISAHQPGGAT